MITIHGSPISPYVRKTLVCLIEKGIKHEVNPVSPFPPPESHLAISPLGKIPAMTDGDLAIPDSSAICGYLERRFPEHHMYPTDDGAYGRALWYEDWADNELPKAPSALFFNRIAVKMIGREPDEAEIATIIENGAASHFRLSGSRVRLKNLPVQRCVQHCRRSRDLSVHPDDVLRRVTTRTKPPEHYTLRHDAHPTRFVQTLDQR